MKSLKLLFRPPLLIEDWEANRHRADPASPEGLVAVGLVLAQAALAAKVRVGSRTMSWAHERSHESAPLHVNTSYIHGAASRAESAVRMCVTRCGFVRDAMLSPLRSGSYCSMLM